MLICKSEHGLIYIIDYLKRKGGEVMAEEICKECNTVDPASHIVHSGTDGIVLGLAEGQLHNICYDCGNMAAFGRTA